MSVICIILIFLQTNSIVHSYMAVDVVNNHHTKVEKNNILNKGVWVRNVKELIKSNNNFMFRGNSIDVDNVLPNDYPDGSVPSAPYITSYFERNKRSPYKRIRRFRKSLNEADVKNGNTNNIDDAALVKSKFITKLKPSTVFNDYPYEIAILLGNNKQKLSEAKNYSTYVINEPKNNKQTLLESKNYSTYIINDLKNDTLLATVTPLSPINVTTTKMEVTDIIIDDSKTNSTKRSMNSFENELQKKNYIDDINATQEALIQLGHIKFDRDVFIKDDKTWQNAPIGDSHRFKVSKPEDNKIARPVTERGLIKVLSMLTNTFKKIMKQHSDIKEINKKLNSMNQDFMKNIEIVSDKFQDFESKYNNLVSLNQKIVAMEEKMNSKEQHLKTKERELSKNLIEFEIQQKKFLTQQRQFYNIQKLMLAQNERINTKQNAIAKTQSEISHRQNNFARILKKAKQIYVDTKLGMPKTTTVYPKESKLEKQPNIMKPEPKVQTIEQVKTTTLKPSTESVKINLFSVPTVTRLQNQDHLLLNDKDDQPVDDLVYKYYFNNTFIDSLMKNFLSGFISSTDSHDRTRNTKSKRDEVTEKTTLLLPVNKDEEGNAGKAIVRERRWINHHSKKKWRYNAKGKDAPEVNNVDDEKTLKKGTKQVDKVFGYQPSRISGNNKKKYKLLKSEPFILMAKNFCNGIGQNASPLVLEWCVEKALRRLQNIEIKVVPLPSAKKEMKMLKTHKQTTVQTNSTTIPTTTIENTSKLPASVLSPEAAPTIAPVLYTEYSPLSTIFAETTQNLNLFFPDNEQLESNLKQFDLKPDIEGNVYYDGSLHASDIMKDDRPHDSDSGMLVGLDSNSRIDTMNPENFEPGVRQRLLQRTLFSRMKYQSMLKKMPKL